MTVSYTHLTTTRASAGELKQRSRELGVLHVSLDINKMLFSLHVFSTVSPVFSLSQLAFEVFHCQCFATLLRDVYKRQGQTLAKEDVCDMDKDFVEKFKALIEAKMGDSNLNVEDLGKDMGLSRVQLYRKIKSLTNYSPNELLRIARLKKAASLLASSDMTVAEIGYEVGRCV